MRNEGEEAGGPKSRASGYCVPEAENSTDEMSAGEAVLPRDTRNEHKKCYWR